MDRATTPGAKRDRRTGIRGAGRKGEHVAGTAVVHQMIRQNPVGSDQTDAEHAGEEQQWWCPECGRRLLLTFPPAYRRVVLEVGDVWTPHVGGSGGITVSPITPTAERPQTWADDDDRALQGWRNDFEGDGATD
jgi:hypothetical protein